MVFRIIVWYVTKLGHDHITVVNVRKEKDVQPMVEAVRRRYDEGWYHLLDLEVVYEKE